MVIIHVTGFPSTAEMPKLIYIVRDILKQSKIKNFWIKELADMRDVDLKEARIEISTYENANKAVRKLDNYYFIDNNICSILSARIEDEEGARSPRPYRSKQSRYSRSRSRGYSRYSPEYSPFRERSRSPLLRGTSKLDLEIELLRKQRLVIEEERKLLLERKKLEMIREYGVSASRELENMERFRDRRARPIREKRRRRERSPQPSTILRKPQIEGIPLFVTPCLFIMRQMKPIILAKVEHGEKTSLDHLIRTQLRRRLAVELENKSFMPAEKVVELYRKKYPVETDEPLITKCLDDLRLSLWPLPRTGSATTKKGDQIKKPDKEIQGKAKNEPGTSAVPVVTVKRESTEKELIEPNATIKAVSHTDDVQKVIETSEATVEQMLAAADNDWIEDGIDWNDDDDDEDDGEEVP